jgi:hypothetical protein
MRKADSTCYGCGTKGHFESECPNAGIDGDGKSPWCGICDERTRLIDQGDTVTRCRQCHPLRGRQLRQFRKCPLCHATVCEWDNAPCGSHSGPATTDSRPGRESIEQIMRTENAQ